MAGICSRPDRSRRPEVASVTRPADEFPIEWLDPSDAELTWEWDDMHMPFVADADGRRLRAACSPRASPTGTSASASDDRDPLPRLERLRVLRRGHRRVPEADRRRSSERTRPRPAAPPSRSPTPTGGRQALPELRASVRVGRGRSRSGRCRATELADAWDEVWRRTRPLLGDPLLGHPRAVPGRRGPRRPVRVDRDRWRTPGRGDGADRRRRPELHDVERELETLTAPGCRRAGPPTIGSAARPDPR